MGLMIHTSGQLKILRIALETLHPRAKEELKTHKKGNLYLIFYIKYQ